MKVTTIWKLCDDHISFCLFLRYRSNEEYVYVRGRGRGKYICGECGIRCKKPSMLKKHIRTHTDVRPYICKDCTFAFKTKGEETVYSVPLCLLWLCCCNVLISMALVLVVGNFFNCLSSSFLGNLTKHMKSKAHGKKCQAMGVSESSVDEPESEETGT